MESDPPVRCRLGPGDRQAIPPGVAHHLTLTGGPVSLVVDFLVGEEASRG
jgi:hypothetical protein